MQNKEGSNMQDEMIFNNMAEIMPKDEQAVDVSNPVVTKITDQWMDLTSEIPEDEKDASAEADENADDLTAAREIGCFSPVYGAYGMETEQGYRIYAYINENQDGSRVIHYFQQYSNGDFSAQMQIAQADLVMAASYKFMAENVPIKKLKNEIAKFMYNTAKDYHGKIKHPKERLDVIEILNILTDNYLEFPVHKAVSEDDAESLYRKIIRCIKREFCNIEERKAYYVFREDEIVLLAEKMEMKKTQLLKKMREYNFLYLTDSSKGYQTCIRNPIVEDFNWGPHTEWCYCILKLEELANLKKQSKQEQKSC